MKPGIHYCSHSARLVLLFGLIIFWNFTSAQQNIGTGSLETNGGKITIKSGGIIDIEGSVSINSGTLDNDGRIELTGDWVRTSNYTGDGKVYFEGKSRQKIDHDNDTISKVHADKINHYTHLRLDLIVDSIIVDAGLFEVYDRNNMHLGYTLEVLDGYKTDNANEGFFVTSDGNEQGWLIVPFSNTLDSIHFTHDHSNGTGQVRLGTLFYRCVDCQ